MSLTTGTNISIDWTVFYWAWWYALAPMAGTYFINISNNKTSLREIILGTIFIGSFGCIFSMLILSNLSISLFENNTLDSPSIIANNLPVQRATCCRDYLTSAIWRNNVGFICINHSYILCTTYDSTAYVLASASMKSSDITSSKSLRVLFSLLLVVQPTLLMFLNGVDSFKWIMVIFSIPLLFINILLMYLALRNVYSIKKS